MIKEYRTNTGIVFVDDETEIVTKIVKHYLEFDVFNREVAWLEKFDGCSLFPKLLSVNKNTKIFTMSYCGVQLTNGTCPHNHREQAINILKKLKQFNCRNNDIRPPSLMVKSGKIRLVDFGWANPLDEEVPAEWPPLLGDGFKSPNGFDDNYSLAKSMGVILGLV